MSERLPPAIAIFFSETIRRRVMPRLGARVSAIRYEPSSTIKSAFVEELNQAMSKAAERLRPDVAPALSIVLVTDPALPAPGAEIIGLIRKACPPNVAFVPQWVGINSPGESWPRDGVAFLLSTVWRGGLIQGGSLDRSYQSLILSLLATETSRVAPAEFDCFARLRFHSSGKTYKVAIDPIDLPDFDRDAQASLRLSAVANYFPEIGACAREAALRSAPVDPGALLHATGSRPALEPKLAEALLCAAISQCVSIAQAAAMLGDWVASASEPVSELLNDLQVSLTHWAAEASGLDFSKADPQVARPLFAAKAFPLLHELKMRLTTTRSQQAFDKQAAALSAEFARQKRAELDRDYYELLPNDLNANQRLAIAAELSKTNGAAKRLTVTRHFPSDLVKDTREEILDLCGLSTVLYAMEMRLE